MRPRLPRPAPRRAHWQQEGSEPDYRFSLANERTFLAWTRTALAVLAGAIVFHQFAGKVYAAGWVALLSSLLTLAAAAMGIGGYRRWKANEIAMRHDEPLPPSRMPLGIGVGVSVLAVLTVALLVA